MPVQQILDLTPSNEPKLEEDEKTLLVQPKIALYYRNQAKPEGTGVLYVTSKRVYWVNEDQSASPLGFSIDFRSIMCHAISRTTEEKALNNGGCIYCQIETGEENFEAPRSNSDDDEQDEENNSEATDTTPFEMTFTPIGENNSSNNSDNNNNNHNAILDAIYQAFSEGALLNPDPESDGEGDFIFNEEEVNQATNQNRLQV